ncbi:MAG TPA: hypothetical protein VGG06_07420 [Thermoanaerobaculia bacterium]|jgi:hypothetical protein
MMTGILEVLHHAFSMPTAIFSVLLILVILYWLVSLLGIFSLEMFEAAEGLADGAADALAEAGESLGEAAEGERPGLLRGFDDVPRSISWSLVVVFAWLFSLLATIYLPRYTEVAMQGLAAVAMVGAVSLMLAVAVTAVALQPLRKVLVAGYGPSRHDLVGRVCVVRTQSVTDDFGQAELDDGGSILQVRNPQHYDFTGGSRGLIYEYDPAREVFYIMPMEDDG